jgi:hypothetical protein
MALLYPRFEPNLTPGLAVFCEFPDEEADLRKETMPQSGSSSYRAKLAGRAVIVKVSLFSRAFRGTILATDEIGFCFNSEDMIAAMREITGSAMADMEAPSVYLPFSTLEWLITSEPKASAASV